MANIQSNFAIAITSMVIVCIILTGFPLACMLANSFRRRTATRARESRRATLGGFKVKDQ
jgi:hypothetical protein